MGKVVRGIGRALKKVKPLKLIGRLAKGASRIAGFIPGVGALPAAVLGGGGALLSGEGIGGALKGAGSALIPGALRSIAGRAGGLGGILRKGLGFLGGRGLPGSSGSLIGQLATAVPGVIGAIQQGKQSRRQNRLLQGQADIFGEQARTARGLLEEAAPLRQGAQAQIMSRLAAGRPSLDFASDRLNPFTQHFAPGRPLPASVPVETTARTLSRRRRRLGSTAARVARLLPGAGGTSGTPFLNAAVA